MNTRIRVRLTPRASRDEVGGWRDGVLLVRVSAPPVEGAANAALVELLARKLGVAKSAVRVIAGGKSREKQLEIEGMAEQDVCERLGP